MSVSFSTLIQKSRPAVVSATSNAMREALAKVPPSHVTKLTNGLRVCTEHNHNAKFATVGIWVDAGTRHDEQRYQGLSKVLQYAGFQGTTNADRQQLSRTVDELGGQLTVETGRDLSFMSLKVAKENVPKAVAFLADVYRNARLSDADVAAAQKEVEFARHQSEELVDSVVLDNLHVCAFDATVGGGLGNKLYGTQDGIAAAKKEQLTTFRNTFYTGPRTLLVGAGGVSHTELEALGQQYLGDLPSSAGPVPPESRFVGGDIRLWNMRTYTFHAAFGLETAGAMSCDSTLLNLVTHIHGQYHRSQHELGQHALHRLVKMYSCHDFGTPTNTPMPEKSIETMQSFFHSYEDTGLVGMYVVGRQSKTNEGLAKSMSEVLDHSANDFARLANKSVEATELAQAKVNYKAQLMYNMDGSHNTAKDLARQVHLYGRRVPLEEMFARIDDISAANVQETLQHYVTNRKPVFSLYGYFYGTGGYDVMSQNFCKYFL